MLRDNVRKKKYAIFLAKVQNNVYLCKKKSEVTNKKL